MAKKKHDTIYSLRAEIKRLKLMIIDEHSNYSDKLNEIGKIKNALFESTYDKKIDDCLIKIGELQGAKDEIREYISRMEGAANPIINQKIEESSKLWYLVRVALKDPTIDEMVVKPGEERNVDVSSRHNHDVRKNPFPKY